MQPVDSREMLGSSTPPLTEREVAHEVVRYLREVFKGKLKVECEALGKAWWRRVDILEIDEKNRALRYSIEVKRENTLKSKTHHHRKITFYSI